jgi:hypothetical protein
VLPAIQDVKVSGYQREIFCNIHSENINDNTASPASMGDEYDKL